MSSATSLAPDPEEVPSYGNALGSEMVDICVGPTKQLYRLHKYRLCTRAPFFDRMFNGGFKEAEEQRAELPEDDCDAFNLFIEWIYTQRLPALDFTKDDPSKPLQSQSMHRIKLYCFAEKYCLPQVMDYTITSLINAYRKSDRLPIPALIPYAYEHTASESKLRVFMARVVRFVILEKGNESTWKSADIGEVLAGNRELAIDVVTNMRQMGGTRIANPHSLSNPCSFFHVHGDQEPCPFDVTGN